MSLIVPLPADCPPPLPLPVHSGIQAPPVDSMEAAAAPTAGVFCSVLITRCVGPGVDTGVNIDTDIDGDSDLTVI